MADSKKVFTLKRGKDTYKTTSALEAENLKTHGYQLVDEKPTPKNPSK